MLDKRYKQNMATDALPDPIVIYDEKGKVTYVNPAFSRLFGWTLAELENQQIDYVPESEKAATRQMTEKIKQGEDVIDFETCRKTRQGKVVEVRQPGNVDRLGMIDGQTSIVDDILMGNDGAAWQARRARGVLQEKNLGRGFFETITVTNQLIRCDPCAARHDIDVTELRDGAAFATKP